MQLSQCLLVRPVLLIMQATLYYSVQVSASKLQSCDVPLIKPSKTLQPGPEIPEFLRVPLTESERKGLLYRDILKGIGNAGESVCSVMAAACKWAR